MKHLSTKTYSLCDTRINGPYRIAFLTDLHSHIYGEHQQELISAIETAQVDAILIGGDMMVVKTYAKMNLEPLEDILRAFAGRYPIYYALGNHEQRMYEKKDIYPGAWEEFRELLRKYRIPLLANKTIVLKCGIELTGVRIPRYYYKKIRLKPRHSLAIASPRLRGEVARRAKPAYSLTLAHTPAYVPTAWDLGADLVLSGHYHGGVMRLPNTRGLISPQFIPFAKHCWGMYSNKKTTQRAITGAGLGTHSVNLRIANPPELVIIEWNKNNGT